MEYFTFTLCNMIINIKLKYVYKIYHVHFLGNASAYSYISGNETTSLKDLKYFYIVPQELRQINFWKSLEHQVSISNLNWIEITTKKYSISCGKQYNFRSRKKMRHCYAIKILIELSCPWISVCVSFVALNSVCSTPFSRWTLSVAAPNTASLKGLISFRLSGQHASRRCASRKNLLLHQHVLLSSTSKEFSVKRQRFVFMMHERYGCTTTIYRWRMLLATRDQRVRNIFTDEPS